MIPTCRNCDAPLLDAIDVAIEHCEDCSFRHFFPEPEPRYRIHDTVADSDGDDGA